MKAASIALLVLTGACMAPSGEDEIVPAHGSVPGYQCNAGKAQALVGQAATASLGTRTLKLSGARTIRWIRPSDMVTMDYRSDRLNIEVDRRNRISAIRCG